MHDSIAVMAEQLLSTLHAPVIAVGFSMGGIVAAEMARWAPESITALGLIAHNASADLPERAAARPRQQEEVRKGGIDGLIKTLTDRNAKLRDAKADPKK